VVEEETAMGYLGHFVKKRASARDAQRPTRKETYIAPSKAPAQQFTSPPRLSYLLLPRSRGSPFFFGPTRQDQTVEPVFSVDGPAGRMPWLRPLYSPNLK
jgi:hypothetical protein